MNSADIALHDVRTLLALVSTATGTTGGTFEEWREHQAMFNAALEVCQLIHAYKFGVDHPSAKNCYPPDVLAQWALDRRGLINNELLVSTLRVQNAALEAEVKRLKEPPAPKNPTTCPVCTKPTRIAHGVHGKFVGCMGYYNPPPDEPCRWTQPHVEED